MTVKRVTFVQELLAFVGLKGRVHLEWISSAEAKKFVEVITGFTEKIKSLGPNPLNRIAFRQPAADAVLARERELMQTQEGENSGLGSGLCTMYKGVLNAGNGKKVA